MKSLPTNLVLEKNRLASQNPWIVLVEATLTDDPPTVIRVARNTEDVTFDGNTYTAAPFELDAAGSNSQGEIPTITLRISNVTRVLQGYLEDLNGAIGSTVKITVVNAAYLNEDHSELEMTFDVLSVSADATWVTFTLGAPNPLRRRFPLYRYIADHCMWTYKAVECGYAGGLPTCKRTLTDCQAHSNSARYGGFKGLSGGYIRLA